MQRRFGIIGARHQHVEYLLDALTNYPEIRLVALAEDDQSLRERFAERFGVPAYADYRQLLQEEQLDAVGVVSINGGRGPIIADCLEAGLHVISDKPICTTLQDLARIEQAWQRSGKLLSALFEKRFYAPTIALRTILERGELGEIALAWASGPHRLRRATRPDWMFRRQSYGGILNDLTVHDIDLLLWLTGAPSGQVQGFTGNRAHQDLSEFEDHGLLVLRTDSGLLASIEAHWLSPEAAPYHGDYRMILTGTTGTAELRWAHNKLLVTTHREPPQQVPLPQPGSIVADFFAALLERAEPIVRGDDVIAASRVALLAQQSATNGTAMRWSSTPSTAGQDQAGT